MRRCSYTSEFELAQAVDILFPLFTPEGEKLWVPGWDYENILGTTALNEDDVFLTKTHDHAANDAIWIVKKYDPEAYYVQYYKIEPEEKVGLVTVKCHQLSQNSTKIQVTYTYTGLSERGNQFIEDFTEQDYEKFIEEWRNLLIEYFGRKG